ncbi:hypothetical protein AB0P21_19125 [Kribbella sp. NPDC056861]|uniref:hypothetical protein n=1 Tax=Kribbella sp. NPDC056861 TaxID=3154857 RepID=UPI0034274F2C
MSSDQHKQDQVNPEAAVEKLLTADVVTLAAHAFVATFTGVKLGHTVGSGRVRRWLVLEFGKPSWTEEATYAFDAVTDEIKLIFERARVASRQSSGQLMLLPRGVQLLDAPDPVEALREFL